MNNDRNIPVYRMIARELKEKIITGKLKPNMQIPSEPELAEKYNVSRMTARKAVTKLVMENFLYRVHGKGTFVDKPRVEKNKKVSGFMEDMNKKGYSVSSKNLEVLELDPGQEIRKSLKLERGEKVYKISRLRFAQKEPIVIQDAYLPVRICFGVDDYDLEKDSLYRILREECNISIDHAQQRLEAISATKKQAKLLDIEEESPLLYVERLTFNEVNTPIEYVESWYRGDKYVYYASIP